LPSLLVTYGVDAQGMAVRVIGQPVSAFTRSIPWRSGMFMARYYATEFTEEAILFPSDLTYRRCLDIVDSLASGEEFGVVVDIDPSFRAFISASQTFIEERSRVGLAIKSRDAAIMPEFEQFEAAVSDLMYRPLRDRQMWDAFFMTSVRWSANFSVPGSGKTASLLGEYAFLRAAGKVKRVVVVCPKNAFQSWRLEWLACFGNRPPMSCFSLGDPGVTRLTLAQRKSAVKLDSGSFNLMLFNYESLGNYVDELQDVVASDTLLVFDEVHRVKAIGGKYAEAALAVAQTAQYLTVMTGTPIPNTYQDIYNMLHLLYPNNYDTFFSFEPGLLKNPDAHEVAEINNALKPFFCRTNKDELGVPRPNTDNLYNLEATEPESELFNILTAAYAKNHLVFMIRALQLESDPRMLREAIDPQDFEYVLDQVGEGIADIDFVDYSDEVPALIGRCGKSTKLQACEDLVMDLVTQGKPVIVWCIFVRSIENIVRDLKSMGVMAKAIYGRTPQDEREQILEEYRAGLFQVLVTNPHTLAESISLHQICHDGVYFEYSYNLVHLLQSKDRIHRLGLPQGQYTQYHFLRTFFDTHQGPWSLDDKIYDRLREKEQTMLEAIDGGYLEAGYLDEEDIEIVLGDLFRSLGNGL